MTTQEQDKLWADLSEESKEQMREKYNKPIEDNDPNAEYFRGIRYQTGLVFGKHNLKPALTYEDVAKELFMEKKVYFFDWDECDKLKSAIHCKSEVWYKDPLNCTSKKQAEKLLAINKLLNVAKFLNKNEDGSDWVPDWEDDTEPKWYFCFFPGKKPIPCFTVQNNCCLAYFRTEEFILQAAHILGEDIVRTALTTEY